MSTKKWNEFNTTVDVTGNDTVLIGNSGNGVRQILVSDLIKKCSKNEWVKSNTVPASNVFELSPLNIKDEIIVEVSYGATTVYGYVTIPISSISDTGKEVKIGFYDASTSNGSISLYVRNDQIAVTSVYHNGVNVKSTSSVTIYYK